MMFFICGVQTLTSNFVLDEYSTVMCICSYMMKSEKAMSEVFKNVARECCSELIEQQLK